MSMKSQQDRPHLPRKIVAGVRAGLGSGAL
jgi:hypothetical protein